MKIITNIKIYTKSRCSFCRAAKSWFSQRGYTFTECNLDDLTERNKFKESYPNLTKVPQIFVTVENDGNKEEIEVGGFTELIKHSLFK